MSVGPTALVVLLALGAPAEEETPVLGAVVHARGAVHSMSRTDLQHELSTRQVAHQASDSDDALRMRLYDARARLLEARNREVVHAEAVLREAQRHSSMALLADYSLDSLLSDDNALFAEMLRRQMLADLKLRAAGGAVVALALTRFAPLGRIRPALLPRLAPSSKSGLLLLTIGMSALLGLLQAATHHVRVALNARSWFTQKVSAVTCRDGILEWMQELDQRAQASHERPRQSRSRSSAEAAEAEAAADGDGDGDGAAPGGRAVWQRRGVAVPILIVSLGSSIFEEVLFRGLLLHGLITRVRMPPLLAATVSSAIFGAAHVGNEAGVAHRAIYAGWSECRCEGEEHMRMHPTSALQTSPSPSPSPIALAVSLTLCSLLRRPLILIGLSAHTRPTPAPHLPALCQQRRRLPRGPHSRRPRAVPPAKGWLRAGGSAVCTSALGSAAPPQQQHGACSGAWERGACREGGGGGGDRPAARRQRAPTP